MRREDPNNLRVPCLPIEAGAGEVARMRESVQAMEARKATTPTHYALASCHAYMQAKPLVGGAMLGGPARSFRWGKLGLQVWLV